MRAARTSTIFAFPCEVSVTIPACEPVSEIASWPRSWIAIAQSAFEIRSPTETSMSYSRGCGFGETSCASRISSSVRVAHRREDGDDAVARLARGDEPARDVLDLLGVADRRAAELHDDEVAATRLDVRGELRDLLVICDGHAQSVGLHLAAAGQRAAERDLVGVLEVAADGEAAREPRHADAVAEAVGEIGGGRLARSCSGSSRARPPARRSASTRCDELVDAEMLRLDAVERARARRRARGRGRGTRACARARATSTGCSTTQMIVRSRRASRQIAHSSSSVRLPHSPAEADALLHLVDRVGERERLGLRDLEDVEREPLRRAAADAGQPRQLRDEVLDGGAEHDAIRLTTASATARSPRPIPRRRSR